MYGLRILVGYPGKSCYKSGDGCKSKLFICGHSHILKVMFDKKHNLLHMNGACGKKWVHQVRTMLRL
jgi:hypothetical protein